jgi:hypothetical protein
VVDEWRMLLAGFACVGDAVVGMVVDLLPFVYFVKVETRNQHCNAVYDVLYISVIAGHLCGIHLWSCYFGRLNLYLFFLQGNLCFI